MVKNKTNDWSKSKSFTKITAEEKGTILHVINAEASKINLMDQVRYTNKLFCMYIYGSYYIKTYQSPLTRTYWINLFNILSSSNIAISQFLGGFLFLSISTVMY